MNAQSMPLTAALSPLAAKYGRDLTSFALLEMAWRDKLQAALNRDDDAYGEASKRFDEMIGK